MYDEVSSSNPPDLPVPAEGAYVWHLEVIVVAVGIDPVSREYENRELSIPPTTTKKNVTLQHESKFWHVKCMFLNNIEVIDQQVPYINFEKSCHTINIRNGFFYKR